MKNMKNTETKTEQQDQDYTLWLDDCVDLAESADFRGLLETYFSRHLSGNYTDAAVGALEILQGITDDLVDKEDDNVCVDCHLRNLIYPEANVVSAT